MAAESAKNNGEQAVKSAMGTSDIASFERYFLKPRSVAVIGASKKVGSIGHSVLKSIMQSGFQGVVYPVNPRSETLMSVKAYPSVSEVPGSVDMAIIVVPAPYVSTVVEQCGQKGVKALIVISDGFREKGADGMKLEEEMLKVAGNYGMRIIGPNCMGLINTDPEVSLNGSFSPVYPVHGNTAILSQSGALGLTVLEYASRLNLGISSFVSVGNTADISAIEFLEYWEKDPNTRIILLYMESFEYPSKFAELAKRISLTKPILVIKSGRTHAGLKAASSHTGAMASKDVASDALFYQTGIIRVLTLSELLDTALLLSNQPLPKGRRIAIVTQAGGAAIASADACDQYGMQLTKFSDAAKEKMKNVISRDLNLINPLDLTGGASGEEFFKVAEIMARDNDNDILICMFGPVVIIDQPEIEDIIKRISLICNETGKTLVGCFLEPGFYKTLKANNSVHIPVYPFPENAIAALSRACDYTESVNRLKKSVVIELDDINKPEARRIIDSAVARQPEDSFWLSSRDIGQLLDCYKIRYAKLVTAATPEDAVRAAKEVTFPVVVKLDSRTITHKTDVGGVVLNVKNEDEVVAAFDNIHNKLKALGREAEMQGVTVSHMVRDGLETIVGMTRDALGPLIMFGIGGVYTELLKDTVFRLNPLTDVDVREMTGSIKMAKLFSGYRDMPVYDLKSVQDLLLRVSALIRDIPEISELDMNPAIVQPEGQGCWVVDARVMIRK